MRLYTMSIQGGCMAGKFVLKKGATFVGTAGAAAATMGTPLGWAKVAAATVAGVETGTLATMNWSRGPTYPVDNLPEDVSSADLEGMLAQAHAMVETKAQASRAAHNAAIEQANQAIAQAHAGVAAATADRDAAAQEADLAGSEFNAARSAWDPACGDPPTCPAIPAGG